jgi:hypothetical protein
MIVQNFLNRLNYISPCLPKHQVEALSVPGHTIEELKKTIEFFIEHEGFSVELDWLYSLLNPMIETKMLIDPVLMN